MRRTLNICRQTLLHTCNSLHKFNTAGIKGVAGGGFNGLLLEVGEIMQIFLPPRSNVCWEEGGGGSADNHRALPAPYWFTVRTERIVALDRPSHLHKH